MKGLIFGFYGMPFFSCKIFLAILMLISRKSVQRRGIGEKKKVKNQIKLLFLHCFDSFSVLLS